jgi:hypothetical protein
MGHDLQNFTLAHILENIFLCYFRKFGIAISRLTGRPVLELLPVQNSWGWLDSFDMARRKNKPPDCTFATLAPHW